MSNAGVRSLEQLLGTSLPNGVRELSDAALRDLADGVSAARHRQAAELAAAGDQALRLVPRMLRGPVRKVLR